MDQASLTSGAYASADLGPRRKPAPPAFAEVFIRVGWRGVEEAYGSRTSCNRRWIEECGGEAVFRARRDYRRRLRDVKAQQRMSRS